MYCKGGEAMSDKKHFNKSIVPKCAYCLKGCLLSGDEEVFCLKKGITESSDSCKSFKYDPLKRVPASKDIGREYKPSDFVL